MASERRPHMPTEDEIRDEALRLFYAEHPEAPTPEDEELKEGSYWERARLSLMSGHASELERYAHDILSELEQVKTYIDERVRELRQLGVEPPEWTLPKEELIARVATLSRDIADLKASVERLLEERRWAERQFREVREAVERLRRELEERARPPAPPPAAAPPPTPIAPPPARPPPTPLSPLKFPRRLASEEIKPFYDAFVYELWSMGLNPEDYMEHFIRFRDAWFSNWSDVLSSFKAMIEDVKAGRPPRTYLEPMIPMPWRKLPEDAVLHMLCTRLAESMDQLISRLEMHGVHVTPEQVTRIVKDEWRKGEEMDTWLKHTPRDYLRQILGVDPADP